MAIVKYIKGSILDADQDVIAHGVNCQNAMGSGVAKVIYTKYPRVKKDYHRVFNCLVDRPSSLLGSYDFSEQSDGKIIVNSFTQFNYGYDNEKLVSYDAIYDVFEGLVVDYPEIKEIAIPKIGCGLAGGNWEIVSRLIDDATGDNLDVYVYEI